jgi:DNA-binding transcriptional LysR family regulator
VVIGKRTAGWAKAVLEGCPDMSSFPPLRKLHYVLAVARELHFRKAAELLNLSQPSLSRRVRELESELGFEIFRRDHHFVETTEAGEAFLADVEQILPRLQADFQSAWDHARNISRRDSALFIIGHSPFVPTGFRRQIRSVQRRKFAYLNLQFRTVFAPELGESIAGGTYQAGVTFAPLEGYGLQQIPIGCDRLCIVTNRNSSLTGNPAVTLPELRCHPLIVACSDRIHPALHQQLVAACVSTGFKPTIAEEVTSPQQAFELVEDGVGLAVLPFGVCAESPPGVNCFPISELDPLPLVFMYRRENSHHAEILGDLADLLQKKCFEYAS